MCGIIGYKGKNFRLELFGEARDVMIHRGPDDAGLYFDEKNGVSLGHRRLSIIDLSAAGHQPMEIDGGKFILIFNGEIFNYVEIKKELQKKYEFKSETDTEVILWAYKEWGAECLQKFNGMFAFVIYDKEKNLLFGARDRVGKKPFYYHFKDGEFIFASEIKALLRMGIKAAPNDKIIYEYLAKGWYEHSDETFFEGINKLPAGHYFILRDNNLAFHKYWDLAKIKKRKFRDSDEAAAEFLDLLRDAVKLRLRSDVPVGINLSGGLDSSTLMSLVQEVGNHRQINAFSACYRNSEFDESPFMRSIVEKYNCPWHQSFLEPTEALSLGQELLNFEDEPYGGIPTISHYKLHKLAKTKGVTVLLEGQGMDEMLAGYKYHLTPFYKDLLKNLNFLTLKEELWERMRENDGSLYFAFKSFVAAFSDKSLQTKHFDYTNPLRPNCLRQTFVKEFDSENRTFPRLFSSELDNFLYREIFFTKIPRVLRFNDRLSMAASIELRMPYLDYRVIEFCFALDNSYKIKKGKGKFLLRKAMKNRSLAKNRTAQKRSVASPQTAWFKNELKNSATEIILSDSFLGRKYFDAAVVKKEMKDFFSLPVNNSFYIWQWINLELWLRKFID